MTLIPRVNFTDHRCLIFYNSIIPAERLAAGELMKEVKYFVNRSIFYLIMSAVAALIWLGAGWLFGGVLSYSSLIVLVVIANVPWLITKVRSVEFPGVVKINFHKPTELQGARHFKDNDKRNRQRLEK